MDLGRRSRRDQGPTLKIDSLGSRMQTASPEFRSALKTRVEIENKRGTYRTIRHGPRFPDNKEGFRKEFYERSLPSQEPSLPHSTWFYWSEFGSTMGALSCPRRG